MGKERSELEEILAGPPRSIAEVCARDEALSYVPFDDTPGPTFVEGKVLRQQIDALIEGTPVYRSPKAMAAAIRAHYERQKPTGSERVSGFLADVRDDHGPVEIAEVRVGSGVWVRLLDECRDKPTVRGRWDPPCVDGIPCVLDKGLEDDEVLCTFAAPTLRTPASPAPKQYRPNIVWP